MLMIDPKNNMVLTSAHLTMDNARFMTCKWWAGIHWFRWKVKYLLKVWRGRPSTSIGGIYVWWMLYHTSCTGAQWLQRTFRSVSASVRSRMRRRCSSQFSYHLAYKWIIWCTDLEHDRPKPVRRCSLPGSTVTHYFLLSNQSRGMSTRKCSEPLPGLYTFFLLRPKGEGGGVK